MSDAPPLLSVAQALARARQRGLDRLDAQMLLGFVLQRPHSWLIAHDTDLLPQADLGRFDTWVTRRAAGEPVAYLLGEKEFHGLMLHVSPGTLVPRPDTEVLVEQALLRLPSPTGPALHGTVALLDLGTGSGAVALALAHARPDLTVTAVDVSPEALDVAQRNARRHRLDDRVSFLQGSWFEPLPRDARFDMVVSNPPYIAEGDAHLPDLRFEPLGALTSGADGLRDIGHLCARVAQHLKPGGWCLLEHGFDQATAVSDLLRQHGFDRVFTAQDLGGNPRCTGGRLKAPEGSNRGNLL